ncbi:unnamed protein product [Dibothriocephalus latus]|uniref:Rhodanese domain-containing protein n=1 Tax=Dibothriocephalus latus TaxID=60516 RepID=A0A3P7LRX6_DIBLA|nr:unnamed protein product [Dibothriocephalus latus]
MSSPARPLYIAKSIQELEKFSDIGSFHLENSKIPGLISKCFSDADSLFGSDDERAYIYYDRGIKLYDKFCSSINTSEVRKLALKRSEAANVRISLRHDLKERYLEEQCKLLDALPVCTESFEAKNPEAAKEAAETKHYPGRWIPPDSLYAMLMTKKPLLFIDVRSRDEFEYRHIEYSCQINLGDKSRICKGVTITRIEKSLSNQERSNWDHRNSVKLIILVDEATGEELIGHPEKAEYFDLPGRHPLKIVYDALVTFHQIAHETRVMDSFVYPKLDDTNYVGDITLTEEDYQPIPPEMPVYPNITVKPYSELAKQLTDMSLGPPGTDKIYPVDSDRTARPKKTDSEKSSENISYPPPVRKE